jgi:hypothetical protein
MRCVFVKFCGNFLFAHRVNVEICADFVNFEIHPLTTVSSRGSVIIISSIARTVVIVLLCIFVECAGLHDSECFVRGFRTDSRIPHLRAVTAVHERGATEKYIAWPR